MVASLELKEHHKPEEAHIPTWVFFQKMLSFQFKRVELNATPRQL